MRARPVGEAMDHGRADCAQGRGCPAALAPGRRPRADDLETGDALLERRIVQFGDAGFDGVVKALDAPTVFSLGTEAFSSEDSRLMLWILVHAGVRVGLVSFFFRAAAAELALDRKAWLPVSRM
jgi:hypothetical protein